MSRREASIRTLFFPILLTAFLATLLLSAPLHAQGRSLEIEAFDATLEVTDDGRLEVHEAIRVHFIGRWNGLRRSIPVDYRGPGGVSVSLFLDFEGATDESGAQLEVEERKDGTYREFRIWVPGAHDATRTVHLRYTIPNALRFGEELDELYWNVTGTEWDYPIQSASALVRVPESATGLRTNAFTGSYGSRESEAIVERAGSEFLFYTRGPLEFREGLTIAVGWEPGSIPRPGAVTRALWFFRANWILLLPIASLLLMWRIWYLRGRDPDRRSIAPMYEPPDRMRPAEIGTLVDHRVDMRDITATMVDLAVRGYLKIEERSEKTLGVFESRTFDLIQVGDRDRWADVAEHERQLLDGIFSYASADGARVGLDDLEQEFYREIPGIRNAVYDRLKALGHYRRRPDRVLGFWLGLGAGSLAVLIPLLAFLAQRVLFTSMTVAVVAAVLTALPILVFAPFMPARTTRGTRALEGALGFEEFLSRVESDRFRRMITGPEMFEEFLPHAMALGVEKKWAAAFDDLYRQPPEWYVGTDPAGFRPTLFAHSLGDFSSKAGTSLASAPRSSSGSGFSGGGGGGGGFSGGGFGGGGGGGF